MLSTSVAPKTDIMVQLQASKDALKIAEILTMRGVDEMTARRVGEMAIGICVPELRDAAIWTAAERLAAHLDPMPDVTPLIQYRPRERHLYVMAVKHAINGFEHALTGILNTEQIAQCLADYANHAEQISRKTRPNVVRMTDVSGNLLERGE